MNAIELERIAAEIIPPVGTTIAIAMVDHEPGEKLASGAPSGKGGVTRYRAGFLVDGRFRVPAGPAFERQHDAYRLIRLLNGDAPAPRPGQTTSRQDPTSGSDAAPRAVSSDGTPSSSSAGPTEAPVPDASTSRPAVADVHGQSAINPEPVICAGCDEPVPPGRHGQLRLTHGPACRQAARRRRAAAAARAGSHSGSPVVTPSRAPTDPPQGEAVGVSSSARRLLRGAANPASRVSRARVADPSLGLFAED